MTTAAPPRTLTLRTLRRTPADDGNGYEFVAEFGDVQCTVRPGDLTSYSAFQRAILRETGALFRHHPAEGRDGRGAWLSFVQRMLSEETQ